MSYCCSCNSSPCCCPREPSCGECSETILYTGENINLAGVGVLEEIVEQVFRFRGVAGAAPITVSLNPISHTITVGIDLTQIKTQETFVDNAQRASLTPLFLGQLGVQINTGDIYIGTSLVAGGWTIFTP